MEHLSNSINARPVGINASPQIMAQMRGGGYNHHSSQPESLLMENLQGVDVKGTPGPPSGISQNGSGGLKSSQSRGALQGRQPELEYDPWYANQQRYLAHQGAALNKQANIYQKHMTDFTLQR